jgi:hypothetical protein
MHPRLHSILPPLAFAWLLPLAAVAAPSEPASTRGSATTLRTCIDLPSAGTSWVPYDDHTILVRSGPRSWQITTNSCPRLADPLPRIVTKVRGGSMICSAHDVQLFVGDSADTSPVPCFIQSITPLSEEQARAIESRRR